MMTGPFLTIAEAATLARVSPQRLPKPSWSFGAAAQLEGPAKVGRSGLLDSPENRTRVNALAKLIEAEIRAGVFDAQRYLHYFPGATRAAELGAPSVVP